jgi:hypothetical protein
MTEDIVVQDTFAADVRTTEDGRKSVLDLLDRQGASNPSQCLKRIQAEYPEVLTFCYNFKFPGKGQKNTPVVSRDNWNYILGLLPTLSGIKYRKTSALVMGKLQDGDAELGAELIIRDHNKERQQKAFKRAKATLSNKSINALSQRHGLPFHKVHDDRNVGLYGKTTKQLRADGDVVAGETPLNYLSELDLSYADAANGMVIAADNPSLMALAASGIADLHKRITGKCLAPAWDTERLTPVKARRIVHSSEYQLEMPLV